MKLFKLKKDSRGMSLLELLLVVGLMAFFAATSTAVLVDIQKLTKNLTDQTGGENDLSLATLILDKAIHEWGPSFNLLKAIPDDSGLQFFDYYPDMPTDSLPPTQGQRILTLSQAANRFEIVVATRKPAQVDVIQMNPIAAYAPVTPDLAMATSSPLVFLGVNNGGVLSSRYPSIWVADEYLLLRVPIWLRYVTASGAVNMLTVPREHSFAGKVSANDLVTDPYIQSLVHGTHPATLAPVASADDFFRSIPTAGGASPLVLVEAIEIVKIALVPNPANQLYDLYSYKYASGAFGQPTLISPQIKTIVFKRESVSRPIVTVELTKY